LNDMYVCLCADMTESQIMEEIMNDTDIDTVQDLAYTTGVCSGCQTCREKVEEILGEARIAMLNRFSS